MIPESICGVRKGRLLCTEAAGHENPMHYDNSYFVEWPSETEQ